jgi:hypothetical protein
MMKMKSILPERIPAAIPAVVRCPAMISNIKKFIPKRWAFVAVLFLAGSTMWTATARADILELRTGEIVQGKFLGGSPMNIRFQVDGQEKVFATRDVLNIGFSDASQASNSSAAPPPPSAPPAPTPDSNADPSQNPAPDSASAPPPAADTNAAQNDAPAPPITIPSGTSVLVRMIDSVDSSANRVGDTFHASLENALVVGDTVVAPKGADAYGKLTRAKEAGKISGSPELTLELTGIRINGSVVPLDSTDYNVAGKGRGSQSAKRIGGGAVVGAVIGGIIGGPPGAAIGASIGAGGGTAVQVLTHGDRVRVPSETVLEFTLEQDVPGRAGPPNQ